VWHREYHRWYSDRLGRDMELLVHGHAGARCIVFPTADGRFYEWEERGMVHALGEFLERGRVQLFCVDSVDAESWLARWKWPGDRAWYHELYDRYLRHEVVPFTLTVNPAPFLISAGASLGAYHAVNFAFRHPDLVQRTIGLSGVYDIKQLTHGYSDEHVYGNDPSHYMLNGMPTWRLEAIRRMNIILAIGSEDPGFEDNRHLSGTLWSRGIWHAFRPWDGRARDWPWWRRMIVRYIGGHD
jgi:esterase/lipase superfamily enzyme